MVPDPNVVKPIISEAQREILVAAAAGAIMSLLFIEPFNWKVAATAIAAGLFSAYFGVEVLANAVHLGPGYYGLLGAVFGLSAMTLLGGFFKLLRMWRDDPAGTIRTLLSFVPFFRGGNNNQGGGR